MVDDEMEFSLKKKS